MGEARDDLALAMGALESPCMALRLDAVALAVRALARLREEDRAELAAWRGVAARQAKELDLLVGEVRRLEARLGPEGDGR